MFSEDRIMVYQKVIIKYIIWLSLKMKVIEGENFFVLGAEFWDGKIIFGRENETLGSGFRRISTDFNA